MSIQRTILFSWLLAAAAVPLRSQDQADLKQILVRLDRLERENASLREELHALRDELHAGATPEIADKLAIQEQRTAELAQTKVEASQRFPIRLTGMTLANAYINSKQNGGVADPTIAYPGRGNATGGATFRQSVIGLDFHGPQTLWGGSIRGSLYMDFFGATDLPNNELMRLRTAAFAIDWNSRTLMVGQDKPIFAPRSPDSLAQVGVAPLAGAGNLWFWEPQARFEQRLRFSDRFRVDAQAGVVETSEFLANVPTAFAASVERFRPGAEARLQLAYGSESGRRIEIAPGFHYSTSHVAGTSLPSDVFSLDWLLVATSRIELSGAAYTGQDLAHFGLGAIRQGFTILGPGNVLPIHGKGGWSQLTLQASNRLSFHLMSGLHDGRNRDLLTGDIADNHAWGGNMYYHLSPNVILSLEMLQLRTKYLGNGLRWNNHYDLALAYLF